MQQTSTKTFLAAAGAAAFAALLSVSAAAQNSAPPHKETMEKELGNDRSRVKSHNDADRAAAFAGARAGAEGKAGVAAGTSDPDTPEGRALTGHEAAHTVQQGSGAEAKKTKHDTKKAVIQNMRAVADDGEENDSQTGVQQHNQTDLEFQRERGK